MNLASAGVLALILSRFALRLLPPALSAILPGSICFCVPGLQEVILRRIYFRGFSRKYANLWRALAQGMTPMTHTLTLS
jgi:hypothetical protein